MKKYETLLISDDGSSDKLALALSGGGARAMAFHLGCLRALHKLGLLEKVSTITAVSGGSVLAGMYCSHQGSFDSFEKRVTEVLRRGFVRPALKRVVTSTDGLKAVGYTSAFMLERAVALIARLLLKILGLGRSGEHWPNCAPFLRKASRTTILRNVFSETFNHCKLEDLDEARPALIVVACELRSKAAFYFTKERLHCWRYGSASAAGVELADAVIASAAYPAALPALDKILIFKKDGEENSHRITLTDGGVYDNLGLAPLWPDREFPDSMPVEKHEWIIACRAGYGLEVAEPASMWMSRMEAAFESVFARAQNFATKRLFDLKESGKLKGFLLPYLGQKDSSLMFAPDNLVSGELTAGYPTNFSKMKDIWIERLVTRGEQIVLAQVEEHWSSIQETQSQLNQ
ncbi:patatin-like phospholipase family protein [Vibrio sp.]|nr:patatin-like phospholipase family protein [Vibrio sp.]